MILVLTSLAILLASALASLTLGRTSNQVATLLGVGGAVIGAIVGLVPTLTTLVTGVPDSVGPIQWNVPYGSFIVEIDRLSSLFVAPTLVLTALAAVYGAGSLRENPRERSLASHWFFFNLATVSIVSVAIARNGILFLMAWEVMSIATFFLVTFDDESEAVRRAGRMFLFAVHIGTAFLFAFFVILGQSTGSLDFEMIQYGNPPSAITASVLFVLAVVGFGTKAGLMPFHVWLPEADPAAPNHVAAVMSGAMVKIGLYGLVRTITLLPAPPSWWGWLLIGMGAVSGIWGILYALSQHDINRLLAYSTIENVGIIALGLGLGLIGMSVRNDLVAVLGLGGALWHALNHAMFKGLLFLNAGAIVQATGIRDINLLGGLMRRMPLVGLTFVIGVIAICGLPPLNGFIGEFLIYLGAYRGEIMLGTESAAMTLVIIGSLALIGGLAVVTFTKVIGIGLLGEPRSQNARDARSPGWLMTAPILILATCCVLLGLGAGNVIQVVGPIATEVASLQLNDAEMTVNEAARSVNHVSLASGVVIGLVSILAFSRFLLLRNREVTESGTWGCGFAGPTVRMQYTASSYVDPIVFFFRTLLRPIHNIIGSTGLFPTPGSVRTETPDLVERDVYSPLFRSIEWVSYRLRWLQRGSVHTYAAYIATTLFILLLWYFGWSKTI